jgi:hypothetical protein
MHGRRSGVCHLHPRKGHQPLSSGHRKLKLKAFVYLQTKRIERRAKISLNTSHRILHDHQLLTTSSLISHYSVQRKTSVFSSLFMGGGGEAEVVKIECVCFYLGNCTLCLPLPPPETLTVKAALYLSRGGFKLQTTHTKSIHVIISWLSSFHGLISVDTSI